MTLDKEIDDILQILQYGSLNDTNYGYLDRYVDRLLTLCCHIKPNELLRLMNESTLSINGVINFTLSSDNRNSAPLHSSMCSFAQRLSIMFNALGIHINLMFRDQDTKTKVLRIFNLTGRHIFSTVDGVKFDFLFNIGSYDCITSYLIENTNSKLYVNFDTYNKNCTDAILLRNFLVFDGFKYNVFETANNKLCRSADTLLELTI